MRERAQFDWGDNQAAVRTCCSRGFPRSSGVRVVRCLQRPQRERLARGDSSCGSVATVAAAGSVGWIAAEASRCAALACAGVAGRRLARASRALIPSERAGWLQPWLCVCVVTGYPHGPRTQLTSRATPLLGGPWTQPTDRDGRPAARSTKGQARTHANAPQPPGQTGTRACTVQRRARTHLRTAIRSATNAPTVQESEQTRARLTERARDSQTDSTHLGADKYLHIIACDVAFQWPRRLYNARHTARHPPRRNKLILGRPSGAGVTWKTKKLEY